MFELLGVLLELFLQRAEPIGEFAHLRLKLSAQRSDFPIEMVCVALAGATGALAVLSVQLAPTLKHPALGKGLEPLEDKLDVGLHHLHLGDVRCVLAGGLALAGQLLANSVNLVLSRENPFSERFFQAAERTFDVSIPRMGLQAQLLQPSIQIVV